MDDTFFRNKSSLINYKEEEGGGVCWLVVSLNNLHLSIVREGLSNIQRFRMYASSSSIDCAKKINNIYASSRTSAHHHLLPVCLLSKLLGRETTCCIYLLSNNNTLDSSFFPLPCLPIKLFVEQSKQ